MFKLNRKYAKMRSFAAFFGKITGQSRKHTISQPTIIARGAHGISRANISENALKVLYRLKNEGHQAHLVGGGVRDLLLGREPKDFDVATDAHPDEVRRVFRNCRLIGRRFRLAHIRFGREIIEVATFRARPTEVEDDHRTSDDGRLLRDNVYGTMEEDAWRRDFSVNALYYNVEDFSIVDYTGGMADLEAGVMRLIGEPEQRYREDPVRMLRAVRFASKLGFTIHPDCEQPLFSMAHLLESVPAARMFDEVIKLLLSDTSVKTFEMLRHYGLFAQLFPETERSLEHEEQGFPITLVTRAMQNTEDRLRDDKPVTPAFLFAVLLWEPVRQLAEQREAEGMSPIEAIHDAGWEVLSRQQQRVTIPKRFSLPMREIWEFQPRLTQRKGRRPARLVENPRFRAAYDFLLLRAESGEVEPELADWWTQYQNAGGEEQGAMDRAERPRRRRRRRRRKPAGEAPA